MNRNKRKICIVVNSRANYGRIKSVMRAIKMHKNLELQLVLGASALLHRYGDLRDLIKADGFEPIASIHTIVDGGTPLTMAKSTGLGIIELSSVLENIKPDIVLTVADRFETIATAIAASYMNIFVAHTQGGEITGSIDENVRHAITKLSHIHFVATERAKDFVIRMGEEKNNVYLTGCPSIDLVREKKKNSLKNCFTDYIGVGDKTDHKKPYIIVLQHPVTTEYEEAKTQIKETIKAVYEINKKGMQIVWLWPNVDAGSDIVAKVLRTFYNKEKPINFHFYKNFSPEDYVVLLDNCKCIVGNSSSGLREGAFLGVPCVNIGTRQRGRERAKNVIDVDYKFKNIKASIEIQLKRNKYTSSNLVGDGFSGDRIANLLSKAELKLDKRINYLTEVE